MSRRNKLKEEHYKQAAADKGLTFVGPLPQNAAYPCIWHCPKCDYTWKTRYQHVKCGKGCPRCNGHVMHTPEEFLARADELQWIVTGELTTRSKAFNTWRCPEGHEFSLINRNFWKRKECLDCKLGLVNGVRVSYSQRELHAMLGGTMNKRESRYSVDVVLEHEGQLMAVEFDGIYFHNADSKERRARRDALLLERGYRILHIIGWCVPEEHIVRSALDELARGEAKNKDLVMIEWVLQDAEPVT